MISFFFISEGAVRCFWRCSGIRQYAIAEEKKSRHPQTTQKYIIKIYSVVKANRIGTEREDLTATISPYIYELITINPVPRWPVAVAGTPPPRAHPPPVPSSCPRLRFPLFPVNTALKGRKGVKVLVSVG